VGDEAIGAIDALNKMGFKDSVSEMQESEKVREKNAKKTSEHILNDGGSAKAPEDSMHLSDDAKEERGMKVRDNKETKDKD